MADWVVCPGCHLRHSQRPDGVCPRCRQPVDVTAAPRMTPSDVPIAPPIDAVPPPGAATLGRLAQSARGRELKSARGILLFVGIVSALVNGFFVLSAENAVQAEIDKELAKLGPGFVVDQPKLQALKSQAVRTTRLINGGGVVLGFVFIGCALLVRNHPVPATVAGLALYLGGNAVFGLLNPDSLRTGIIVKVIIVAGLFKAVQAAIAYQKELAATGGA